MSRVVVTGGAGKAGRAVVRDLLERDYDAVSVDLLRDPKLGERQQLVADLTNTARRSMRSGALRRSSISPRSRPPG